MPKPVRVRFAPSPTGHLHIGGARTALFNWLFAKKHGGTFVLRIEDTDVSRSTAESEKAVIEDLRWLGLDWDEGPDIGGPHGPYRQSQRLDIYADHAQRLLKGGRAYRCYCTDEELEAKRKSALARGQVPQYDGTCRALSAGERDRFEQEGRPSTVRLRGPEKDVAVDDVIRGRVVFSREMLGDFIIMRSDGRPTYNFAVVVDDALMEISHVIRAEDHLPNTMRQTLIYESLGLEAPVFAHVSLIVDRDRSKLSKRRGASSVAELREEGFIPDGVVNYLALLGWSHPEGEELLGRDELIEAFDLSRVSPSPAAYDEDKLLWVNSHVVRSAPAEEIAELAVPFMRAAGLEEGDGGRLIAVVDLVREGVGRLSEIPDAGAFFFAETPEMEEDARAVLDTPGSRDVARALAAALRAGGGGLDAGSFTETLKSVGAQVGARGKDLYMPVRAAITGRTHGPSLGRVAEILGRDRVVARLEDAAGVKEGGAG